MLGHDDGDSLGLQLLEQLRSLSSICDRHARGRLIEHQQSGPAGERDGEFEPLLVAMRQLAGALVDARLQADAFEDRPGFVARSRRSAAIPPGAAGSPV